MNNKKKEIYWGWRTRFFKPTNFKFWTYHRSCPRSLLYLSKIHPWTSHCSRDARCYRIFAPKKSMLLSNSSENSLSLKKIRIPKKSPSFIEFILCPFRKSCCAALRSPVVKYLFSDGFILAPTLSCLAGQKYAKNGVVILYHTQITSHRFFTNAMLVGYMPQAMGFRTCQPGSMGTALVSTPPTLIIFWSTYNDRPCPVRCIDSIPYVSMKSWIRPVCHTLRVSMLDGVEMNVIRMPSKIVLAANLMLPESS